jgi:hypothetical protein
VSSIHHVTGSFPSGFPTSSFLPRGEEKYARAVADRGPSEEGKAWLKKLAELETQKERLLDLYLENKLEMGRYEKRLAQIEQSLKTVQGELARIEGRAAHVDLLERDRDALLNHYSRIVPEHLDNLKPEERNRVYKMLDLTVMAHASGSLDLRWALGGDPCGDNEPPALWNFTVTTSAPRFRAVLTGDGSGEIEVVEPQGGADPGH